jgi:diketogulonate reductase-like aldo/keto reductase
MPDAWGYLGDGGANSIRTLSCLKTIDEDEETECVNCMQDQVLQVITSGTSSSSVEYGRDTAPKAITSGTSSSSVKYGRDTVPKIVLQWHCQAPYVKHIAKKRTSRELRKSSSMVSILLNHLMRILL